MKSIIQNDERCWFCGRSFSLQRHHVMAGVANRPLSERFGLWIWVCPLCHTGKFGVQYNREKSDKLKATAQEAFEDVYGHDRWMQTFRKNYKEGL